MKTNVFNITPVELEKIKFLLRDIFSKINI